MATRTNDLTEFAKPTADKLFARCGSLKRVLSAGVLALDAMTPGDREFYMAKAIGEKSERTPEAEFRRKVLEVVAASHKTKLSKTEENTLREAVELIRHYAQYKIPGKEESRLLDSLRKSLGPTEPKKQKKKAKGA